MYFMYITLGIKCVGFFFSGEKECSDNDNTPRYEANTGGGIVDAVTIIIYSLETV